VGAGIFDQLQPGPQDAFGPAASLDLEEQRFERQIVEPGKNNGRHNCRIQDDLLHVRPVPDEINDDHGDYFRQRNPRNCDNQDAPRREPPLTRQKIVRGLKDIRMLTYRSLLG
jgi:hypothetical protein